MRGYGDDPWRNAMQGVGFLGDAMRTGQQIGEVRHEQDERDATNKAYEYITGKLGSSGDLSALDGDSILNTRHGVQAMGKFMLDRANTEQSRLSMLKNMEAALPSDMFMRVHRSYIVNLRCIKGYVRGRVFLSDTEYVPIGENYKESFQHYIESNFKNL